MGYVQLITDHIDRFNDPIMILNLIFLLILINVCIDQVSERDKYYGELCIVKTVQRIMMTSNPKP